MREFDNTRHNKAFLIVAAVTFLLLTGVSIKLLVPAPQVTRTAERIASRAAPTIITRPLAIVPARLLAPGCTLGTGEETDAFARMSPDVRTKYVNDAASNGCEFALDFLDISIDPDRTSPGHTCNYSPR